MNDIATFRLLSWRLVKWFLISLVLLLIVITIFASLSRRSSTKTKSTFVTKISYMQDYSNPIDFNNPTLSKPAYVFVNALEAKYVEFRIDNKLITTDKKPPFELRTVSSDSSLVPFDFSKLPNGQHILTVTVVYGLFNYQNKYYPFNVAIESTNDSLPEITQPPITNTVQTTVAVPTVSSDSNRQWLIYSSDQDTPTSELFFSKIDGSNKRRLTNDSNYSSTWPRVTPDGKTVYFYRIPPGQLTSNYFEYSLWKINIDGTGLKEIYPKGYQGWWLQGHVDIAPTNNKLVFAAIVPFKGMKLLTANMDGSNIQEIPTKTKTPIDPSWTPDGRILFTATPQDQEETYSSLEVFVTTTSGVGEKRLTFDNFRDHDPVMSPDQKRVAILTHEDPNYMFPGRWTQRILNLQTNKIYTLIGIEHFSANPYWVNNDTTVYSYWDWDLKGWGIKMSKIDGSSTKILVKAHQAKGLTTAQVGDPFAFNMK